MPLFSLLLRLEVQHSELAQDLVTVIIAGKLLGIQGFTHALESLLLIEIYLDCLTRENGVDCVDPLDGVHGSDLGGRLDLVEDLLDSSAFDEAHLYVVFDAAFGEYFGYHLLVQADVILFNADAGEVLE